MGSLNPEGYFEMYFLSCACSGRETRFWTKAEVLQHGGAIIPESYTGSPQDFKNQLNGILKEPQNHRINSLIRKNMQGNITNLERDKTRFAHMPDRELEEVF